MIKKPVCLIFLTILLFLLSGCEELFTFNLFDGLEKIDAGDTIADIAAMPADEGLGEIEELLGSDDFIDALDDDDDAVDDLLEYLEDIADDDSPENTENRQTALVLIGEVYMKVSGGDDVVNNVANLLTEIDSQDLEGTDPMTIIDSVIPDDLSEADLTEILENFWAANSVYEALGDTLDPENPASLQADVTPGDLAQNALVANIIAHAIDDIAAENDCSAADAAAILARAIISDTGTDSLFSDDYAVTGGLEGEDSGINNILILSGLADLVGIE